MMKKVSKSDMSKKKKIDEHVEVEKDDQEKAEMKRHIEIVKDDEVAIDAIPLATKPLTGSTHTDEESELMKAFETRVASPHSTTPPSDSTSPLSPDHPLPIQTSLTPTPSRAHY
ncbi:hypothetical protein Tco_1201228 [Tanacetum coccineum]